MVTPAHQSETLSDTYSTGCHLCQRGEWLCIFITYLCNARCRFCPAPLHLGDNVASAFGCDPYEILRNIKGVGIKGISFSGGDSFLAFDRMLEWLRIFRHERRDIYYWSYTNGLAATEKRMRLLANAGLNELRFNIAATGYHNARVLRSIAVAAKIFPKVTVEVPSIPGDFHRLAAVLPDLDEAGVAYLNLHEYILEAHDPAHKTTKSALFLLNQRCELRYDPASSENTRKVRNLCRETGLDLKVNDCSLRKKENQMLRRRLTMGEIHRKSYEKLTDEGLLATYVVTPEAVARHVLEQAVEKGQFHLFELYCIHPDELEVTETVDKVVTMLVFFPPLDLGSRRSLKTFERIR